MQASNANETSAAEPVYIHYDTAFPELHGSPSNGVRKAPKAMKPCVLKSNVMREFIEIPSSERKALLSNGGKKQNTLAQLAADIIRQHSVHMDINSSKSQSLTIVISGTPENVANAKCAVVRSLQTQSKLEIHIDPKYHRFIIGKGGSTLMALERETTTKIQVPSSARNDSDIVTVTGPKHGCDAARRKILSIVDTHSKLSTERLNIPKMYHAFIKGPRRNNITRWTEGLKVRIDMAPPSSTAEDICVSGEKQKVDQVLAEIDTIYKTLASQVKRCVINVPKAQHRLVFGPKGSGLDDILEKTGVSVELPQNETDEVVLIGPPTKMGAAMSMVIEKASSSVREELVAPNRFHKILIGKSGSALASLLEGYQDRVRVEFGSQTDRIELDGPVEDVAAVKDRLSKRLKELERTMAIETLRVPSKYHGPIIGRDGANIRRLRDKYGCQFSINQQLNETSEIVVEGEAKSISQAVAEIHELVKRLENEKTKDLIIEPDIQVLLRTPAGGAPPIRALYDEFPKVTFHWAVTMEGSKSASFNATDPSMQVCQLMGQRQDVDSCADKLNKLVKSAKESNYHHEFRVYKEFRATFFARENNKVRAILSDLQCRLQNPPAGTDSTAPSSDKSSELWWVVGQEKKVHEAVDRIDALQRKIMDMKEVRLPIPPFVLAKVVGHDAPRLRSIKEQCDGVSFKFPRTSPEANTSAASAKEIIVYGPSEAVAKAQKLIEELNNKVAELCDEEVVTCDKKFHGMLIGRSGQNIAAFREKHRVELVFPDRFEINPILSSQIHILGSKSNVPKAKKELLDQIKALEDEAEVTLTTPDEFVRNVRQAANRMQERVRVNILRGKKPAAGATDSETPSPEVPKDVEIKLSGPKAMVETTRQTLALLIDDLKKYSKEPPREFPIKDKFHARVIGRMKNQLPDLEADYRVIIKVELPTREQVDNMPNAPAATDAAEEIGKVTVYGNPDQVDSLWEEAIKPFLPISEKYPLDKEFHRYLVMQPQQQQPESPKKRDPKQQQQQKNQDEASAAAAAPVNKVTELQNAHGVFVKLPAMNQANADFITISGTPSQIKAAEDQLKEWTKVWEADKADRLARSYEEKMDILECYIPFLLESKADLWKAQNVILRVDRDEQQQAKKDDKDELTNGHAATKDEEEEEQEEEEEAVHEEKEEETAAAADIEEDEHADMLIPPDVSMMLLSEKKRLVTLRGYQDKVEQVKKQLEAVIAEMDGHVREVLNIPQKVHSQMIGAKRSKLLRMQREYGVQIEFAGRGAKGDSAHIVVVMGPSSKVDDACNFLIDHAQELLDREESRANRTNGNAFGGGGGGGQGMRSGGVIHFNGLPETKLNGTRGGNAASNDPTNDVGIIMVGAPWDKKEKG